MGCIFMHNRIFICSFLYCIAASGQETAQSNTPSTHPIYIGGTGGYGATTWEGLVPSPQNQNIAMKTSTPVSVTEGGTVLGFFVGYEFSSNFAIEANYMHYPSAKIFFDEDSMFAFDNDGVLELSTQTETISLMAKLMLEIPRTKCRAYSSFGVAEIHRKDNLNVNRRDSATFGLGLNYNLSEHFMAEIGGNYTAGYGESELNPAKDYVPFLYSGFLKLAYRI